VEREVSLKAFDKLDLRYFGLWTIGGQQSRLTATIFQKLI